jgi:dihydrofolate reductase
MTPTRAGRSEEEERAAQPIPEVLTVGPPLRGNDEVERPRSGCKLQDDERTNMGKTIMGVAAVSLDGFIADDNDDVGPLFDWLGSGDVRWSLPGSDDEARSSRASVEFMTSHYANTAANVIGRRLFDLTNGWDGKPAAYEHVFVVTYRPPTEWEHLGTAPFTFVDGVEEAIAAAKEFARDRDVDLAGGQIGMQALQLGLIDQVVLNPHPGGLRHWPAVLRHRRAA